MLRKFDDIRLRPVIDSIYSFTDARKAFERLDRGAFVKSSSMSPISTRLPDRTKIATAASKHAAARIVCFVEAAS
jgi:hypothetical protein